MSSSSIHLKTINGPARLRLLDHQMKPLATGYGELEQTGLDAGLYMIEIDAGSHHEERILSIQPGERYSDLSMEVEFPSAVPMGGTSTSHEYHSYPAQELSQNPNLHVGTGGRLMLFVRHVEDTGGAGDAGGNDARRGQAIDFGALSLLHQSLEPVVPDGLAAYDVGEAADGWAGICADLDPGGYALESSVPQEPLTRSRSSRSLGEERVQQSLWVAEGWTTLVFLPCLAGQSLPSLDLASIHMTPVYAGFQPYEDEAMRVNLAAEMATHGFRTGERMLPVDLLNQLLHTKFQNPMLGVLGAHVLLQSKDPNWRLFDTVVKNLRKMIGDAPDCVALEVLGRQRRGSPGTRSPVAVSWPPMLAAGYRGLIAGDAGEPGLVQPDSVADHAAAGLHTSWPWSRWSCLAPGLDGAFFTLAASTTGRSDGSRGSGTPVESEDLFEYLSSAAKHAFSVEGNSNRGLGVDGPEPAASSPRQKARELAAEWLEAADVEPRPVTRSATESPEVVQVADYLERMAEQTAYGRADILKMDLSQLSKRVGLPVSAVRRAVGKLKG